MRGAYIECHSGIAGDMCVGALIDMGVDFYALREALGRLPLSGYTIGYEKVKRGGFRASHFKVNVHDAQPARHYSDIEKMVEGWHVDPAIRARALHIFDALAEAESTVHGTPKDEVHFHEVGAVDSIIDVCGAAWAFHHLAIDQVAASPINVGGGTVETEHGMLPVPAPATLELLKGLPVYSEGPEVELTTPTGAAILRTQVHEFGRMPEMTPQVVGVGAGTRELPRANVVRIIVGERTPIFGSSWERDEVDVLETNLDDVTGEVLGFLTEQLLNQGALDVSQGPLTMKKNRPGIRLTVLAQSGDGERLAELIARETGALGLRTRRESRLKVPRAIEQVSTRCGKVRIKVARLGAGVSGAQDALRDVPVAPTPSRSRSRQPLCPGTPRSGAQASPHCAYATPLRRMA